MSAPGSSSRCCAIEVDGGIRPARMLAPHLLVGRHRLDGGVVLVGAHQIALVGAGGLEHRVEVLEDALGLLLALGTAAVRHALRQHVGRDAGGEILRHQPGGEHPAAGFDAAREPDLARAKLDGEQRLHCGAASCRPSHPHTCLATLALGQASELSHSCRALGRCRSHCCGFRTTSLAGRSGVQCAGHYRTGANYDFVCDAGWRCSAPFSSARSRSRRRRIIRTGRSPSLSRSRRAA